MRGGVYTFEDDGLPVTSDLVTRPKDGLQAGFNMRQKYLRNHINVGCNSWDQNNGGTTIRVFKQDNHRTRHPMMCGGEFANVPHLIQDFRGYNDLISWHNPKDMLKITENIKQFISLLYFLSLLIEKI